MTRYSQESDTSSGANAKLRQGTAAWFEMVGELLCDAAVQAKLSPNLNLSLVERYTDGIALPGGLIQGLRLDISGGTPSFRVGVFPDEVADVVIEVTANAARALNTFRSDDPEYSATLNIYLGSNEMQIAGDLSEIEAVFASVHDPIVQRTI